MIKLQKSLGQNLLINKQIIKNIISIVKPKNNHYFMEVGSGTGLLTKNIYKFTKNLITVEIDPLLINILKKNTNIKKNNIINNDILKLNFNKIFKKKKKIRIIGNIPYYISKKIIFKCIRYHNLIKDIHITVQKEFAQSLKQKNKYNKISLLTKLFFDVNFIFEIDKKNFYPQPQVTSQFISLIPNKNINKCKKKNIKKIKHIINIILMRNNKKIKNNITNILKKKELINLNINPNKRANKLSFNEYIKIINYIK